MLATNNQNNLAAIAESALIQGDLRAMNSQQRVQYYLQLCESVGLNPYTKPFIYVEMKGKLVLYPRKEAANQLAKNHGISFDKPQVTVTEELITVCISVRDRHGRTDSDMGIVPTPRGAEDKANAIMKAITKAKRRAVFSLVGMSDAEDIEQVRGAQIIADEVAETLPQVERHAILPALESFPEHAQRVLSVREALGIEKEFVIEQLKLLNLSHPKHLTKSQCDAFIMLLAVHSLDGVIGKEEAIASYARNVPAMIAQGMSESDAVYQW
ncbi:MAG TPA: hypothetical protein VE944_28180, partial [Nostoc sp.]|uniref:hypothetical protein n=1 Tax=Nostoc sp. TaxID=1180 RepID=UPI002D3D42CA